MRDVMRHMCLPQDDALKNEVIQREYGFSPTGKINLVSKKDIVKRGGVSPDIADALALTYSAVVNIEGLGTTPQTYITDYDVLRGH